ncbi:hypothetical protein [Iningainema tapete]|uniref:Uncharacterized protein n=1 Tax=Iningainema tapete BLCC-T55 TaxID=2748662 RepID=A0A8J7BYH3_9CYAN|nr:hypothetical protein [Iningainema tapete]MBD2775727.1 hypothetical protein [Iningainema tapete BLCC-T55]
MSDQSQKVIKEQKIPFCLSVLGLSVSVFALHFFLTPTAVVAQKSVKGLQIATVKSMDNGDNACYVTLVDQKGKVYQSVYANFEICAKEKTFLNNRVRLSYEQGRINDCQSAEPCGKSKQVTLITRMQVIR